MELYVHDVVFYDLLLATLLLTASVKRIIVATTGEAEENSEVAYYLYNENHDPCSLLQRMNKQPINVKLKKNGI